MQQTYIIIWVAKAKDRSGVGKNQFTKNEAEALAAELNNAYPGFRHLAINTANEDPVNALAALRESLAGVSEKAVSLPEFASQQAHAAELVTAEPNGPAPGARKSEESATLVWAA